MTPDLGPIRFQAPRDAGGVLNATFALVRQTAKPLGIGYLAIVGPVALAGGLATALFFRSAGDLFSMDPATADPEAFAGLFGPTYFGTLLFSLLTLSTTLAFGAAVVRLYRRGEPPEAMTVGALWDETRPLILPALGMTLAFLALFAVSAVINAVPCLGTLAWLAGIVWLTPILHVTFAIRMVEGGTLGSAVARARDLVRGRWGLAAGGILLTWLIAFVAMSALSLPFYTVAMVVGANSTGDPQALFETMGMAVGPLQVLTTAVYILPTFAAFFVHGALDESASGGSLWGDLDRLGGTEPVSEETFGTAPPPLPASPDATDDDPSGNAPGFRGGGFGPSP